MGIAVIGHPSARGDSQAESGRVRDAAEALYTALYDYAESYSNTSANSYILSASRFPAPGEVSFPAPGEVRSVSVGADFRFAKKESLNLPVLNLDLVLDLAPNAGVGA